MALDVEQNMIENTQTLFQAVGVIQGNVTLSVEKGKFAIVSVQGKDYPLFYIPSRRGINAFGALNKEIEATGNTNQRLIVYPKIIHFPGRDQPHQIAFQLVGFDNREAKEGITASLADFEFKLSGLWQFIPVCQTPCISIFKNFTDERLQYVKRSEVWKRVKFMKGSHIPLLWKDAPIRPFRFNPKLEKEQQGHASFVSVKAKFLPHRDLFGFDSLLALPQDEPPKFFKASKKMKAEALQASKEFKKAQPVESTVASAKVATIEKPVPKPKPILKNN